MLLIAQICSLGSSDDSCPRKEYPSSVAFVDLTGILFEDCLPDESNGGAIYASNPTAQAVITDCRFINCAATGMGGALYFSGADVCILRCSFVRCRTGSGRTAGWAYIYYYGEEWDWGIEIKDTLATECSCGSNALTMRGYDNLPVLLTSLNLTAQNTSKWGSAFMLGYSGLFQILFCEISFNVGMACMIFDKGLESVEVRCLVARGNNCIVQDGEGSTSDIRSGLFYVEADCSIWDSVIAANVVTHLVGADGNGRSVTFTNCHFEAFGFPTTGGLSIATVNCQTDGGEFLVAPECALRTGTQLPIGTEGGSRERETQTFTMALFAPFRSRRGSILLVGFFLFTMWEPL
jgi:hypothetical protein